MKTNYFIRVSSILFFLLTFNLFANEHIELEFTGFLIDSHTFISEQDIVGDLPTELQDLPWHLSLIDKVEHLYELKLQSRKTIEHNVFWQSSYRIQNNEDIEYCDPIFIPAKHDQKFKELENYLNSYSLDSGGGEDDVPGDGLFNECSWEESLRSDYLLDGKKLCYPAVTDDFVWVNSVVRYRQAWEYTGTQGEGIFIGHPDSGYSMHPEVIDNILMDRGKNFEEKNFIPIDSYEGSNHGHGTTTSSLMISPPGKQGYKLTERQKGIFGDNPNAQPYVEGISPGAKVVPYRVTNGSVVMFSFIKLTKAIHQAIKDDVDVLSISLGGPLPMPWLHRAVKKATDAGIIIVAANGNYIPDYVFQKFVVWPAHYNETVSVAASDPFNEVWKHSSKGDRVDITAPGAGNWVARARMRDGERITEVTRGAGTSYSTALTAGAAAIFLAHYDKDYIVDTYGKENITKVFKYMLAKYGSRAPEGWDTKNYGPGILDVLGLVQGDLPDPSLFEVKFDDRFSSDLEHMRNMFPEMSKHFMVRAMRRAFRLKNKEAVLKAMSSVGHELKLYFAKDKRLRDMFYFAVTSDSKVRWKRVARFRTRLRRMKPSQNLINSLNL